MKFAALILVSATSFAVSSLGAIAQEMTSASGDQSKSFDESGKTMVDGRQVSYLIRRLPVNSFPDLPDAIADALTQRGCMIPQTYQAYHPENVVHASLERAGSSDWAVLCSSNGSVQLLVFFARNQSKPVMLASAPELECVQRHDTSGVLGFDWGIDGASPQQVREAQSGMEHRPPLLDHDALADTVINQHTIYHFFSRGAWGKVDLPQ